MVAEEGDARQRNPLDKRAQPSVGTPASKNGLILQYREGARRLSAIAPPAYVRFSRAAPVVSSLEDGRRFISALGTAASAKARYITMCEIVL